MGDPWLEFSESDAGPGGRHEDNTGWAWPVTETQVRDALQERGLRVALVRLFPGRRQWWIDEPSQPLAILNGLLPDLEDRLGAVPGYAAIPGAELRIWSVPPDVLDRVTKAFEREGLPLLLERLSKCPAGAPLPTELDAVLRLDGDVVRLGA